jgi:hypothetical protein
MSFRIVSRFLKTLVLTVVVGLGVGAVQNVSAQPARRIAFTPCRRIPPLAGNLTKKKSDFLYAILLTKGQVLRVRLSAKPASKGIYLNVYRGAKRSDTGSAVLRGESGNDYDLRIEETGEYSIEVSAERKVTRFSLTVDVEDKRWKC